MISCNLVDVNDLNHIFVGINFTVLGKVYLFVVVTAKLHNSYGSH